MFWRTTNGAGLTDSGLSSHRIRALPLGLVVTATIIGLLVSACTTAPHIEKTLLRLSDLPPGWSPQSDSMPPGYSLNGGGPNGRYQVETCLRSANHGLVFTTSKDFGTDNQRAWNIVITGGDLRATFAQAETLTVPSGSPTNSPPDCFLGVVETESMQVKPDQLIGHTAFGQFRTAPIDLGSYGLQTSSQEVTLPYTTGGQEAPGQTEITGGVPGQAFLDVAVIEMPKALLIFGFWSSEQPPLTQVSKQVIQKALARAS